MELGDRSKQTNGIRMGRVLKHRNDIRFLDHFPRIQNHTFTAIFLNIAKAVERSKSAEEQIKDRYGSYTKGLGTDISSAQKEKSPYYFWNEHLKDDQAYH